MQAADSNARQSCALDNTLALSSQRCSVLTASELAEDIIAAWERTQHAVRTGGKDALRAMHVRAKRNDQGVHLPGLIKDYAALSSYFPEPSNIDPRRIDVELVEVGESRTLEGRLFRLLRGYWSMPFSKGYGRRLRFLVMDRYHNAVIGLIGLQSPAADLKCRDEYLRAGGYGKLATINRTLDAYTIGASPSYSQLVGGKLVAGLVHSEKIRHAYLRKYCSPTEHHDNRDAGLLAVTTTSAFGRSSIYNRLKHHDRILAKPLGFTKGFGTIHLEELYPHIVSHLKDCGRHVPAGFGNGPKVRWQNVAHALDELGISRRYLSHGVERQVFIFEFAKNLQEVNAHGAQPNLLSFDDKNWAEFWLERWCLRRSESRVDTQEFSVKQRMETALRQFSSGLTSQSKA
jgi:hypothetical protein